MPSGECTSTTDRTAGGDTGRLFLMFGGPVCADRISYCSLDRVLTYKNLIYLLNLQFCCKMAHNVVLEVVKIVSGPFLPLCQLWFPPARLHVSDFPEECALPLEPLLAGIFIQIVLLTKLCPHSLPLGPILVVH